MGSWDIWGGKLRSWHESMVACMGIEPISQP
jgi:hypothetical protein